MKEFGVAILEGLIGVGKSTFCGILAEKLHEYKKRKYLLEAVTIPFLLHGFFDFILMIGNIWAIIIFVVYVIILWKVSLDKLDKYTIYSKIRYYRRKYKCGKGDKID